MYESLIIGEEIFYHIVNAGTRSRVTSQNWSALAYRPIAFPLAYSPSANLTYINYIIIYARAGQKRGPTPREGQKRGPPGLVVARSISPGPDHNIIKYSYQTSLVLVSATKDVPIKNSVILDNYTHGMDNNYRINFNKKLLNDQKS